MRKREQRRDKAFGEGGRAERAEWRRELVGLGTSVCSGNTEKCCSRWPLPPFPSFPCPLSLLVPRSLPQPPFHSPPSRSLACFLDRLIALPRSLARIPHSLFPLLALTSARGGRCSPGWQRRGSDPFPVRVGSGRCPAPSQTCRRVGWCHGA